MALKSFRQLFDDNFKVTIPMIQRDYAQGRRNETKVREGFVKSLADLINGKQGTLDFIYGSLENDSFIPLDGQQRLTTLYLLHWLSAKREGVAPGDYSFLRSFSYRTRANSRYFCEHLVDFIPDKERDIEADIRDQKWYRLEWNDDPTVDSMLRMLSYLDAFFYPDRDNFVRIWDRLDNIRFYVFYLKELGLTDDIYIKMNSRGKPLTDFEHFKAALDRISTPDFARKIDIDYTDRMWRLGMESDRTARLRADNKDFIPDVDTYLLNFIHVVSRMICLATTATEPSANPMDWIADIYARPAKVSMLQRAFDCVADSLFDGIFDRFLCKDDNIPGKVNIDRTEMHLLDLACVDGADKLGYAELLLLYSFLLYTANNRRYAAGHPMFITEDMMRRRLRVLRNLLKKSNNEFRPERISEIFREVGVLILNGRLSQGRKALNDNQRSEEIDKLAYIAANPGAEEAIAAIENHPLLLGALGAMGWDRPELFDTFRAAFHDYGSDSCMLTRAMLTFGDFSCSENAWRWRIGIGQSGLDSLWRDTFFVTRDNNGIASALPAFLCDYAARKSSGMSHQDILASMIDAYSPATFSHISYIIKYPAIIDKARYGKFFVDDSARKMGWIAIFTQLQPGRNWSIIHLAIADTWHPADGQKRLSLGEYRDYLQVDGSDIYLDCTKPDAVYLYRRGDDGGYTPTGEKYALPAPGSVDVVGYIIDNILPAL